MAAGDWWQDHPGLRSVFGAIVQAASEHVSTADVWDAVYTAAESSAFSTLSTTLGREPSADELQNAVGLTIAGVGAVQVSQARAAAGQMVAAYNNLHNLESTSDIETTAIARPPWSITTNVAGVAEQYRIRVLRTVYPFSTQTFTRQEWSTYNLSGPITNVADALNQANTLWGQNPYNRRASIVSVDDYAIESV